MKLYFQHRERSLTALWWLLLMSVTVLFVREVFELIGSPYRYLKSKENIMEMSMVVCTYALLALFYFHDPPCERPLSAVAVLLAWAEALLLLGRHPSLSIFVMMFTTVAMTFFRLLLVFSVLLIGFVLSFYFVFNPMTENRPRTTSDDSLKDLHGVFLKVYAMMTGELAFVDLPFDSSPVTSRIIFAAFLFFITIVLFNLLNGLAVSDTAGIQKEVIKQLRHQNEL